MENNNIDTSKVRGKEDLVDFIEKVNSQQNNGPFPTRDSGILKELTERSLNGDVANDAEQVEVCPLCNSLYLMDDNGKVECYNCGNQIEEKDIVVFESIFSYLADRDEDR